MARSLPGGCLDLLTSQQGVIARWQAAAAGLDGEIIDAQLRWDRWQPLYRGTYAAFTGRPSRTALIWAAVLRAGPGAAASHHTSAELDHLIDRPAAAIHVTVSSERRVVIPSSEGGSDIPTVMVHYSARLGESRHPTRRPPRTRIEDTALDLAQSAHSLDDAWCWLTTACARRLSTPERLLTAMNSRARLRWRADLTAGLADVAAGLHSGLERRYVHRVERPHGLPTARRQALSRVAGRTRYLDNHYEKFGVAVELDGRVAHPAEARWRDIRRDNSTARAGTITLRYSWPDVTHRQCQVAFEVAEVLRTRGWSGQPVPCGPGCPVPSPPSRPLPSLPSPPVPSRPPSPVILKDSQCYPLKELQDHGSQARRGQ